MRSSKLRLSAAILGAIFAVSAVSAKAIPATPFPTPAPTGKVAFIPATPFPTPAPTGKLHA